MRNRGEGGNIQKDGGEIKLGKSRFQLFVLL